MFKRKGKLRKDDLLVIFNMTVNPHRGWKATIAGKNNWRELYNSDSTTYWGSGHYMNENIICTAVDKKRKLYEINFDIPALAAMIFH